LCYNAKMEYRKTFWKKFIGNLISLPIIWLPFPAFLLLDILFEFYHHTCFPIYGIPKAKRSEYIQIFDRNKLSYLRWYEKLGCMYCGYANGLLLYLKEIASRTEKYWCGIMHKNKGDFKVQQHQVDHNFSEFDNEEDFYKKYPGNKN